MSEKDLVIIRWVSRRGTVSYEDLLKRFKKSQIKGAFRRGFIRMNPDRDGYMLTKSSRDFLKNKAYSPIICIHCYTYNARYAHYCEGCDRATRYRISLNVRIMKGIENEHSSP